MPELNALLARIGDGLFQQAWVVADLEAAEQAMRSALGCSRFRNLPPADIEYEVRGKPVSCALALGFARSGNVQIELIQPVRGDGIHFEFLARYGPGAHHLGFLVDDIDALVAFAASEGFPVLMSGRFGSVRLCYLDTFDALGLYVELIEDPGGTIMALMPWRDPPGTA